MMPLDGTAIQGPFCWTKMQAEAGEPIDGFVNRKELERLCGGGEFWWGVGESRGRRRHRVQGGRAGGSRVVR